MYDTGQIDYDGDQGSGFGGMGGVDPTDMFQMFFGGGMGGHSHSGFSSFGGGGRGGNQHFSYKFAWWFIA